MIEPRPTTQTEVPRAVSIVRTSFAETDGVPVAVRQAVYRSKLDLLSAREVAVKSLQRLAIATKKNCPNCEAVIKFPGDVRAAKALLEHSDKYLDAMLKIEGTDKVGDLIRALKDQDDALIQAILDFIEDYKRAQGESDTSD